MKKLLCVLMFGMMFGYTELTTRVYELPTINFPPYEEHMTPLDIQAITGYDLDNVKIEIFSINDH